GPMDSGMLDDYINRKHGLTPVFYEFKELEPILKETYGVIVYQEQVQQIAMVLANYSAGAADILRRAMGKKKIDVMMKMKPEFIEGAKRTNGLNEKVAEEIFDLIEKFANYGFNKSHSLAYAILAYQTAYLKAHYPAEFIAANLNAEINNPKQIPKLIEEAKSFDINVLLPDVNRSFARFVALDSKTILYGLAGIKNVGPRVEETIVNARKEKPFSSFFDFVSRVDPKVVNKKVLEALVCTGAFDSIENGKRAALYFAIDTALEYSKKIQEHTNESYAFLFGDSTSQNEFIAEPALPDVPEWGVRERLVREKAFLNFYFSGHPLDKYRAVVKFLSNVDTGNIGEIQNGAYVRILGILNEVDSKIDKNKQKYAFASLEDFNGKAELVIWSDTYSRFYHLLEEDRIVLVAGKSEIREENILKVYVNEIYTVDEALKKFFDTIHIYVYENGETVQNLKEFAAICNSPGSSVKVLFILLNNGQRRAFIAENVNFELNFENILKLLQIFGEDKVKLIPKNI
ncbi:MAG: DNA polymerase III subunit alpha, partial [Candidatus Kapaibacteriota bacterium]